MVTATGCGVSVRDYEQLLADDPAYAQKARRVSSLYCDLIELVEAEIDPWKQISVSQARRGAYPLYDAAWPRYQ